MAEPWGAVRPIVEADAVSGFRCGKHALDDYLARHALANDRTGVSKAFVLPGRADLGDPTVMGYYAWSIAGLGSSKSSSRSRSRCGSTTCPTSGGGTPRAASKAPRSGGRASGLGAPSEGAPRSPAVPSWAALASVMPDWAERKTALETRPSCM